MFKREDLQQVRSYKIRGAYNKMSSLSASEVENGIVNWIPNTTGLFGPISILVTVNCGIDTEIVEIPESNTKVIWVENREIENPKNYSRIPESIR